LPKCRRGSRLRNKSSSSSSSLRHRFLDSDTQLCSSGANGSLHLPRKIKKACGFCRLAFAFVWNASAYRKTWARWVCCSHMCVWTDEWEHIAVSGHLSDQALPPVSQIIEKCQQGRGKKHAQH
jgi:hypothetical protein